MTRDELLTLVGTLDLTQKVGLLTGATVWRTRAEPAVGLREMVFSDGPAGVRGEAWDERSPSLLLPSASALGSLWDERLAGQLGELLAHEALRKGVHVVLAPTLNLHRTPLGGRHFECLAEDPELAARTGAALIRGIQAHGVAATAKHYVANDSETERLTMDVRVDERTLREVYLAPFEAAVRAGVWLVMSAYNGVNGTTMTANELLAQPLKGEWGFDGAVVSDWGAVRLTAESAAAAQDLAMPGPDGPWGEALVAAVRSGVPEEAVDDKVVRLLTLADRVGALGSGRRLPPHAWPGGTARRLLRRAVAAGTVLLRNEDVLPLDVSALHSVAVIGRHACAPRLQGEGSAGVYPADVVTPLDGIRARLHGRAQVRYAPGPDLGGQPLPLDPARCANPLTGEPGVLMRILDAAGREMSAEHRLSGRQLEPPLAPRAHTVEISALVRPPSDGKWTFGVGGYGRMSLAVDGQLLVEGEFARDTEDPAVIHLDPPRRHASVWLAGGQAAHVVARRELAPDTGRAVVVTAAAPEPEPEQALAEAVEAARDADVAVVVVGTTDGSESEGHDRTSLTLPGRQDELVAAVAAVNPRTVVVVNSGGPVELPWREQAGAVLLSWFPGQEAGSGLADVLFGQAEPGGRLPTTWAAALADVPVRDTTPRDGVLEYAEGLHIGYRAWLRAGLEPAYWFGHGLGYTTWSYDRLRAASEVDVGDGGDGVDGGEALVVEVQLRNTGARPGREVVQVYLARPESAVERPVRWLVGFTAVRAEPGETVTASVRIPARMLRHWDTRAGRWRSEAGVWRVLAGRSAGDLPLTATVRRSNDRR
ncbi:glycoside hydrolase family 3 C-terminal domain-containing protein [Streptomyces durmitorensis]|uniref:Glycoside hydrolase family 3 C-terminal domain-containing protein n=1 Tax=Streptomyces durmitorensis TaxID=319947 RepID=A0ABY4Q498_9ACTN|nr:glycoside hydrolase family 3 C-terminal domain-containing protein [Streptomyces durmitorensis]UQT61020.1 glycoside hydrolase family 3 C-terminal domain-containing protein [Streptomyces durmitorensis]